MKLSFLAVFFSLSAFCLMAGTDVVIDGSDLVVPSEGLSVDTLTFKSNNRVVGDGTLTFQTADKGVSVDANVTASIDVPVAATGNLTISVPAGSQLDFNGPLTANDCLMPAVSGVLNFNAASSVKQDWYGSGSGTIHFYETSTSVSAKRFWVWGPGMTLHKADCFVASSGRPSVSFRSKDVVLDVGGEDQHFAMILQRKDSQPGVVHSADPATVYFSDGGATAVFDGIYTGKVSVEYSAANKTNALAGVSTSVGSLSAVNQTIVELRGAAKWSGATVRISGGARLSLLADGNLTKNAVVTVSDADTSRIEVAENVIVPVHSLVVDGTTYDMIGSYGAAGSGADFTLGCLMGKGKLYVTKGADIGGVSTWTGGGTDRRVSTVANWGGTPADYSSGFSSAKFATGGTGVDVAEALYFKGLVFSTSAALATFSLDQSGGGSLSVLGDGIVFDHPEDGVARTFSVNVPYLAATQTLSVPGEDLLSFSAGVSAQNALTAVTKSGAGSLRVRGSTSVPGGLLVQQGAFYPYDGDSIGVAGSKLTVDRAQGGRMVLERDVVSAAELTLTAPNEGSPAIEMSGTKTNVFSGKVHVTGYPFAPVGDQTIVLSGGVTATGGYTWFLRSSGTCVVREKPIAFPQAYIHIGHPDAQLRLEVANNAFSSALSIQNEGTPSRANLLCTVPWALNYPQGTIRLGLNGSSWFCGKIDLGGCDQGVVSLLATTKTQASRPCEVVSSSPAVLYERTTGTHTTYVKFGGAAGYRLVGSGSVTLAEVSDTTGSLGVTNGTLVLTADARWTNATEVVVGGMGRLTLSDAKQVSRKADWRISDSAQIYLPEGVCRCDKVYIDGCLRGGSWGGPESGADNVDSRFTGPGRLCGRGGMVILLR